MLEKNFQRKITKLVRQCGGMVWVNIPTYQVGIPDLTIVYKGNVFFVELKVGKNKETPIQQTQIAKIRKAGGNAFVLRHKEEIYYDSIWLESTFGSVG